MPSSRSLLLVSALFISTQARQLAHLVHQERSTYNGGWALGLSGSSCPADAPVACSTDDGDINPTCCPSGQTCFGFESPYCCPGDSDCVNVVSNLPVCANSTWNLYQLRLSDQDFFCCEPGQYGVLPLAGYAGICEPLDQAVASSRIATSGTPAGGGTVATVVTVPGASTSTVTSTLAGGGVTTITTASPVLTVSTATSSTAGSSNSGSGSGSGSNSNTNSSSSSSKKSSLSTGAIVGVAIGGVAVILLIVVILQRWYTTRQIRRDALMRQEGGGYAGYNAGGGAGNVVYAPVPNPAQQYQGPSPEYKSPVTGVVSPMAGYPPSSSPAQGYANVATPPPPRDGTYEAPQRWEGAVEMGEDERA